MSTKQTENARSPHKAGEAQTFTPGPIYADVRIGMAVLSTKPTPNCLADECDGELIRYYPRKSVGISDEMAANFKLWAASPDLLSALEVLVRVVGGTLQGYGILEAPMKAAKAAIAKAVKP